MCNGEACSGRLKTTQAKKQENGRAGREGGKWP